MLTGIRGTLWDVHVTVVTLESCIAAVTFIAAGDTNKWSMRNRQFLTAVFSYVGFSGYSTFTN